MVAFSTNAAYLMQNTRINILSAVNAESVDIDRLEIDGEKYVKVSNVLWMLDDIVLNDGLYAAEENQKGYASMEGRIMPFGHPKSEGEYVAISNLDNAAAAKALGKYYGGVHAEGVIRRGDRYYADVMVNERVANAHEDGKLLLEWINKAESFKANSGARPDPIHMSTGLMTNRVEANGKTKKGKQYKWRATNQQYDHLAILFHEPGAGGDQVALAVNCESVINSELPTLEVNEDALDDSYGAKRDLLNSAIYERFGGGEVFAYLEDFNDQFIVYCVGSDKFRIGYHWENENPVLHDDIVEVQAKTEYMIKNAAESWMARFMGMFKNVVQLDSVTNKPAPVANEEIDMTPEELQAALDAQAEKLTGAFNARLDALAEENKAMRETLQANANALVADKRKAVAAEFGEVVANALQGEALDEMFAKCQKAAPIVGGFSANTESDAWAGYSMNSHMEAK